MSVNHFVGLHAVSQECPDRFLMDLIAPGNGADCEEAVRVHRR